MPQLAAFSIHLFTASGAACALFALLAATRGAWAVMFAWLGIALLIDGIDGSLARGFKVKETLPRWSGEIIDWVVDFTTYVFVPAYALAASDLLPPNLGVPLAAAIVVTGAIYFADNEMKTRDHHFKGFPALWNAVAFHLFLLKPPPAICALVIVLLLAATFAPLTFIHPLRVTRWRGINMIVLAIWAALGLYALVERLQPGPIVTWAITLCAVYLLGVGCLSGRCAKMEL